MILQEFQIGFGGHYTKSQQYQTWVYGLWNTPSRKALPGGRWRAVPILACAHRYCTYFSRALMPKTLVGSWVASFFISSRQASGAESCTTGRAGGLNYEPLKAVENLEPPKGGGLFK
jgi:hypothetical protein